MGELIHNMPFAEYLSLRRVSAHGLMLIQRSPAHYIAAIEAPRKPTQAQALGTHVHGLTLEPDTYRYAVIPDVDRRTKAGKEVYAAFIVESEGVNVVTAEQHETAMQMRAAVMDQPYARALFADGDAEVSMLWECGETKVKCRADFIPSAHHAVIDLKTAQDASFNAFSRAAANYKYDIQAALYTDAALECGLGERPFIFIVVENEPPHAVALYQMDDEAIAAGRWKYQRAMETYRECKASGEWPAYPVEIQSLSLPKWSLT